MPVTAERPSSSMKCQAWEPTWGDGVPKTQATRMLWASDALVVQYHQCTKQDSNWSSSSLLLKTGVGFLGAVCGRSACGGGGGGGCRCCRYSRRRLLIVPTAFVAVVILMAIGTTWMTSNQRLLWFLLPRVTCAAVIALVVGRRDTLRVIVAHGPTLCICFVIEAARAGFHLRIGLEFSSSSS